MATRRLPTTAIPINGPALRRLRMHQGIAVVELADKIGVTRSYLTRIELGEGGAARRVSPRVYVALLRELAATEADLAMVDSRLEQVAA